MLKIFATAAVACIPSMVSSYAGAGDLRGIVELGVSRQSHTCAITTSGALKCWGSNGSGQLGYAGPTVKQSSAVNVLGLGNRVSAVAGGRNHTCALTAAGGVKCWGRNESGQLGDGTTTGRLKPVDVAPLSRGVKAITAEETYTCALTTAGGVKCWGSLAGIGGGTSNPPGTLPVDVPGLTTGVVAISAGFRFACALMATDNVMCWGYNDFGQLGDGSLTYRLTPAPVAGLTQGIVAIATSANHACALNASGTMQCWGGNGYGQLGDGTTTRRLTPVDVQGLSGPVKAITASDHTCAILASGSVQCWGNNGSGQLGIDPSNHHLLPVEVPGLAAPAVSIIAGTAHTCAGLTDGGVRCWGGNYAGQVGNGSIAATVTSPSLVAAADHAAVEFYNAVLDHYFVTADPIEVAATENGVAGPGWMRTGGSFQTGGSTDVCRFYGSYAPGPNSHFFAADGDECQGLLDLRLDVSDPRRASTKSWNFEGFGFTTARPSNGACPAGTRAVYRAYNNGFARGVDSNHRITADRAAIAAVVARGWIDEGVVLCAPT